MAIKSGDRVVLFGGSGFVGRALISRLNARGLALRVVTRHPERHRDLLVYPTLALVRGDIHDDAVLARALADCHAVVNLVGILEERAPGDFARVHEQLPERLAIHAPQQRIVHASAAGAHEGAASAYFQSKARGEARLRARSPGAVILRPSIIYGPGDHFVCRFLRLLRLAPLGLPLPQAAGLLAPVHVQDVAQALVESLFRPRAAGGTYDLCGPEVMTLLNAVHAIARAAGHTLGPWPLSPRVSLWLARLAQHLPGRPFTVDQWRTLASGAVCASPADSWLGIRPRAFPAALDELRDGRWAC